MKYLFKRKELKTCSYEVSNRHGILFWKFPTSKNDDKDIEHFYVEINLRKKKWLNENNVGVSQFELFRTIPLGLLNESASSKKKIFRNNQSSFITKEVRKAIMTWLYVLIMSRTRFWVNLHSIFAWMSRNSFLETGAISEV